MREKGAAGAAVQRSMERVTEAQKQRWESGCALKAEEALKGAVHSMSSYHSAMRSEAKIKYKKFKYIFGY